MTKEIYTLARFTFLLFCGIATAVQVQAAPKVKKMTVTATAYNSLPGQTDSTPNLAAWNNRIRPGDKIIAVSRDLLRQGLTNGVRVKIVGLPGTYTVRDKMNKRWRKKIDIYMGTNKRKALRWGARKVSIVWMPKQKKQVSLLLQ